MARIGVGEGRARRGLAADLSRLNSFNDRPAASWGSLGRASAQAAGPIPNRQPTAL